MNLFITDPSATPCAQHLDDLTLNQSIINVAFLLSTAVHMNSSKLGRAYGLLPPRNEKLPWTTWTRKSRDNFISITSLGLAYLQEYQLRAGHNHAASRHIVKMPELTGIIPLAPAAALPDLSGIPRWYHPSNPHARYRAALQLRWYFSARPLAWTGREQPDWPLPEALLPELVRIAQYG